MGVKPGTLWPYILLDILRLVFLDFLLKFLYFLFLSLRRINKIKNGSILDLSDRVRLVSYIHFLPRHKTYLLFPCYLYYLYYFEEVHQLLTIHYFTFRLVQSSNYWRKETLLKVTRQRPLFLIFLKLLIIILLPSLIINLLPPFFFLLLLFIFVYLLFFSRTIW